MPWPAVAAAVFGLIGMGAERLASAWPALEAQHRGAGWRTAAFGVVSGAAAYGLVANSHLPPWATIVHLVMFGLMIGSLFKLNLNGDAFRATIESLPPADYLGFSYYERWIPVLGTMLLERGVITEAELQSGRSQGPMPKPGADKAGHGRNRRQGESRTVEQWQGREAIDTASLGMTRQAVRERPAS